MAFYSDALQTFWSSKNWPNGTKDERTKTKNRTRCTKPIFKQLSIRKTSLGLVNPIDGTLGDINNNGKRFLRRQKPSEDDDSDVDDSDVDEERINASKLKDLVNGKTRTQFTHWGDQKLSPSKVWDKLKGLSDTKRKMVYDWYYKDIYRNGNWRR
ncbi:hypothetical protein F443_02732 [Phytophthora nicotianae P1569]|uniref:RxLR effector protein n=1 Tax=Phytophthora nicotianae P1569 TaxID=1317065 RepID=V9FSK6_PHYNI|nr:hypothetical protein F443_02732 [Phytophthora nicotianae P1569]